MNALLNRFLPPPNPPLDVETRAKLLATVHRVTPTGIVASVLLPLLTTFAFWRAAVQGALLAWCAVMLVLSLGAAWFYLGYRRDATSMSRSAHTRKWWTHSGCWPS